MSRKSASGQSEVEASMDKKSGTSSFTYPLEAPWEISADGRSVKAISDS
jgi:hypothetical protein